MSVLYISNVGQMACLNEFVWVNARREFKYTESIFIVSAGLESEARKLVDQNAHVIALAHPFHGVDYYEKYIDRILKTVVTIINDYRKSGMDIEEIVINTAGGTEKMSLIIKDCVDVLKRIHPNVRQIWGAFAGSTSIYTDKPEINMKLKGDEILAKHLIAKKCAVKTVPTHPKIKEVPKPEPQAVAAPVVPEIIKPVQIIERKEIKPVKSKAVLEKERLEKEASAKRKRDKKREKAEAREYKRLAAHNNRMSSNQEPSLQASIISKAEELTEMVSSGVMAISKAEDAIIEFSRGLLDKLREKFNKEYTSTSDEIVPPE